MAFVIAHRRRCRAHQCRWDEVFEDKGEADLALADHAAATGHALCRCCARSLEPEEAVTCLRCRHRTRAQLASVVDLYALLPAELGVIAGRDYRDNGARSSEDVRIDTVLVLLSPSNTVTSGHAPVDWEAAADAGLQGWWHTSAHGMHLPDDPTPAIEVLGSWEDDWRTRRREPAAPDTTVVNAVSYLTKNLDWAAEHVDEWPDFAEEVERLHRALLKATAQDVAVHRSPVSCFDCGRGALRQRYLPPKPCRHTPPHRIRTGPNPDDLESLGEYRHRFLAWRRGHGCDQGGRVDSWTCTNCGRTYKPAEYWLAVSAHLGDSMGDATDG